MYNPCIDAPIKDVKPRILWTLNLTLRTPFPVRNEKMTEI